MTPDMSKQLDPSGKDVFTIIIEEHRMVDMLGEKYKQSADHNEKQQIAHNVIKLLSLHAACEEMVLYPVMKDKLPDGAQQVAHALQEHLVVKELLLALDNAQVGQSHFDEKFLECLADIQIHVQEEEQQLLPALRQAMSNEEVMYMTEQYITSQKIAPTRPHPEAPNTPPENRIVNAQTAPLDHVRDAGRFSSA